MIIQMSCAVQSFPVVLLMILCEVLLMFVESFEEFLKVAFQMKATCTQQHLNYLPWCCFVFKPTVIIIIVHSWT